MSDSIKLSCIYCGKEFDFPANLSISRSEECPHCYHDLHCCKMCSFFSLKSYNECREPNAERVVDKDKSNFCEYYEIEKDFQGKNQQEEQQKMAFEALFKK